MEAVIDENKATEFSNTLIRDMVLRSSHANSAIQRLQSRILKESEASEVITSYDRMHHRHNRS